MSVAPLAPLVLPPQWAARREVTRTGQRSWTVHGSGENGVTALIERCILGRLRSAYPVGIRDVEIVILGTPAAEELTETLTILSSAIQAADPRCRRVVFAAPAGDVGAVAAAEAAGFRFVVDVDLPGAEVSLCVFEPMWV